MFSRYAYPDLSARSDLSDSIHALFQIKGEKIRNEFSDIGENTMSSKANCMLMS